MLPALLRTHGDDIAAHVELPRRIIDNLGAVPSYYLRYYYQHDLVVQELLRVAQPRRRGHGGGAGAARAVPRPRAARQARPAHATWRRVLQRGGDQPAGLASSATTADVQVVDVRNNGTIPQLPDDAVIEVPARVGQRARTRSRCPALPPHQAGLIAHTAAYEALAASAAVSGDRDVAFRALLTHPLIGQSGSGGAAAQRHPRRQPPATCRHSRDRDDLIVAVDGGNSKTDVVLLRADGTVLSSVRGSRFVAAPARPANQPFGWSMTSSIGHGSVPDCRRAMEPRRRSPRCSWRAPTCPPRRLRSPTRWRRRGGPSRTMSPTTSSRCSGRRPARDMASRSPSAPVSTASAPRRPDAGRGFRLSAISPATGAADPTSAWPHSEPGCAARTGGDLRTTLARSGRRVLRLATALEVAVAIHQGPLDAARLIELPPLVVAAAEAGDAEATRDHAPPGCGGHPACDRGAASARDARIPRSRSCSVARCSRPADRSSWTSSPAGIRAEAPKARDDAVHDATRGRCGARRALACRCRRPPPSRGSAHGSTHDETPA